MPTKRKLTTKREDYLKRMSERNTTHGLSKHPFFLKWRGIIDRCYKIEGNKDYKNYGGRGIYVAEIWRSHPGEFLKWCERKNPAPGLTLDRIDNDGPYSPENCEFRTAKQQNRNIRKSVFVKVDDQNVNVLDFAEQQGVVPYHSVMVRVRRLGWSPIDAATTPIGQGKGQALRLKKVMIDGREVVFKDLVDEYGVVSYGAALQRVVTLGWPPLDAARTPQISRRKKVMVNGELVDFKKLVEKYGVVSYGAALQRVTTLGWPPLVAAQTPQMHTKE